MPPPGNVFPASLHGRCGANRKIIILYKIHPKLIFRSYEAGDLDSVTLLDKKAFPIGPYTRSMMKRVFNTAGSFNIMAVEDGRILGYAVALPLDEKSADIESIAVDPDIQRSGLGSRLIGMIEEKMRELNFQYSVLEVRDMNEEALNFYRKHGYVAISHMPTYYSLLYRGSRGAYRMVKKLSD